MQINHIRALTCQPCWALLGKATVMLRADYVLGHLKHCIESFVGKKWVNNRLTTCPHQRTFYQCSRMAFFNSQEQDKKPDKNPVHVKTEYILQTRAFLRHLETGQAPYLPFAALLCSFTVSQ